MNNEARRAEPRELVSIFAGLGRGVDRTLCKVTDLSALGARIHTSSTLKQGTAIWLTLPVAGQVAADVMWTDDLIAGCRFRMPLQRKAFRTILDLCAG